MLGGGLVQTAAAESRKRKRTGRGQRTTGKLLPHRISMEAEGITSRLLSLRIGQEDVDLSSSSRCLDVFIVALNQSCDRQRWYTSTKELQLASIAFCVACRNVATLRLRVDYDIPGRLLAATSDVRPPDPEGRCPTRVPPLRARAVTWNIPSSVKLDSPLYALADVEVFEFGLRFCGSIEDVVWPRRLRVLELRHNFYEPVVNISWPPSLQQLSFGFEFNQPVVRVSWPPSLLQLTFGFDFDQPVDGVSWPPPLRQLTFGRCFNQPVAGVSWPPSLQQLTFGSSFNQPVAGVSWPLLMQRLTFGDCFNQAVEGVSWPPSLQKLKFGRRFNQPIARVAWPASLQEITFGDFREDYTRYWSSFDHAIDQAVWPASLKRLTLGGSFGQSLHGLGRWMPNLEEFTLIKDRAKRDNGSILVGIEWPKGLKRLKMRKLRGDMEGVVIPPTVEVVVKTISSTSD